MSPKRKIIESYNEYQISRLASNVLDWYNAFFVQTKRLIDTQKKGRSETVDKEEQMPNQPESFFWITTLHHAVNGITTLRDILDYHNDFCLDKLCDSLAKKTLSIR